MGLKLGMLGNNPEVLDTLASWYAMGWPDRYSEEEAVDVLLARRNLDEVPLTLVLFDEGELVGTASLTHRFAGAPEGLGPWVSELFVAPSRRGEGLGALLATAASRVAWSAGAEELFVAPAGASPLFESAGWGPVELPGGADRGVWRATRPEEPPSFYELIGGEENVRALVDRFYDLMDELPRAQSVRQMHAKSLRSSRQKLFEFLSGWMGGPNLYIENRGHPRLRMRHMPFEIGTEARDQWLLCMDRALEEIVQNDEVRGQLKDSFARIADHMRNRPG